VKTQRTIVKDIIDDIAPMVLDSGVCPTTPEGIEVVLSFLNKACFELHTRIDSEGTLFEWYVPVEENCFALPQDCREARQIGINGLPLRQRSEFFIGKVATGGSYGGCAPYECRDLGDFYIPKYLPKTQGIRIALVATEDADAGKEVIIEVTNEHGVPVRQTLTLLRDALPVVMDSVAFDVTFFKKPKTTGPVLLQLHYDNGQRFNFCSYLPDTEEGLFRRKQLPAMWYGCNLVRILGKTRFVKIDSVDQILPFNHPVAIGWACSAIAAWRRRDDETNVKHMNLALESLKSQMRDADSASNEKQVKVRSNFNNPSLAGNYKRWS
tara:strand:- start:1224 stop:2195 length:972 start_codon:yes stop_codon:yes gene_type:complete